MRRNINLVLAVAAGLMAARVADATQWVCDFTSTPPESFTGTDGAAVANYADTLGGNPNSFTVTVNQAGSVPAGWLTQGTRSTVPTTAKFFNAPGGGGGRARFTTLLPATMDANGGVAFAWTARYGSYSMGRAPIQLAVTTTGGLGDNATNEFNCYIRVVNGTQLRILNNGGGNYGNINELSIANVGDGLYHQWSCSVITSTGLAHWKLWIDGVLQLFTGTDGAHLFDPGGGSQQFSFQTAFNNYDSPTNGAYIGLGELASTTFDPWDFEFDCVAYKDDGLAQITCGSAASPCDSLVTPSATQTSAALKAGTPTPASIFYTFTNTGSGANGYTVAETDAGGGPQDYPWLQLSKSGEAVVSPLGGTDQVAANIIDTDLAGGTYTAYITFTHTCTPVVSHTRRIDLTITDCAWTVTPRGEVARSVTLGSVDPQADAVFTVTNTGRNGLTFSVVKEGVGTAWLTLNSSGGGPLNNGQTSTVTASINPNGVATGVHTATLRFTNTTPGCTNALGDELRTVVLHVLGPSSGLEQFNAEFTAFTGSDATSLSPVVSCDPNVATTRQFFVPPGAALQVDQLDPNWLTQGSISGTPTTALFNNPPGPAGAGTGVGRARFATFLPFGSSYDPTKGLAVAWRMRIGDYSPTRGPIQITFPRVAGPFGTSVETLAIPGDVFNAYIRIQNGDRVSILRNGGQQYNGIGTLILPADISESYHQWTAAVCYHAADQRAYWNLWIDGVKLLFSGSDADGSAGSPVGPGGATYSFRTFLENVTGDPYVGLGEQQTSIDIWNFEFDWVRMLTYNVGGCPFWDGEGCVPAPLCNTPWADADGDGDVDSRDFSEFQMCYTGSGTFTLSDPCKCFDRNHDQDVDFIDFQRFSVCGTRDQVDWVPTVDCP